MKHVFPSPVLGAVLAALALLPLAAGAQTPAPAAPAAQAVAQPAPEAAQPGPGSAGRPDQAIQRIRNEDAGSRIDELRVGGETQSITVQPKTGNSLPAYEVKPSDSTRGSAPSSSSGDTNGSRVWNVLKF